MDVAEVITEHAARIRGVIINQTIALERQIDVYLCEYFCKEIEKQDELIDLLMASAIPFETKRNLFVVLFKKHNRAYYDTNKGFFEDLAFIIKNRNVFAHYLLDTSKNAIIRYQEKREIGFIKFKEVTDTVWFTSEQINYLKDKVEYAVFRMIEINDKSSTTSS